MPRPPKPIVIINSLTIIVITSRIVLQLQNTVLEMAEADEDLPGITSAAGVRGLYSGEERWANDSDAPFADMEELEEDEAAIDDD